MRLITALLLAGSLSGASPPPDLHPSLRGYETLPAAPDERPGELRVRYFGTSTLLFYDGYTAILIDGFFSRPGLGELKSKIRPNDGAIHKVLGKAPRLDAVLVTHSHYDHAMDSAAIAALGERTLLIGSRSTAFIGEGARLSANRNCVVAVGDSFTLGAFSISVIGSKHGFPNLRPGHIRSKLTPPAWLWEYKEGDSLAFLIEHRGLRMLVNPSAGFRPRQMEAVKDVDVVFLAIGGLGAVAKSYWKHVVSGTEAKLIIPTHWDNFRRPLDKPLEPTLLFERLMRKLVDRADREGRKVRLMAPFEPVALAAAVPSRPLSPIDRRGAEPLSCPGPGMN